MYNHTLQVDPKASICYNCIFDIWHERQISNLRRRKHLKDKKDRARMFENDDMIVQAGFEMTWSLSRGVCNADKKVGFEMAKKYRTNFSVYVKSLPVGEFWEPYFNRFYDHGVYLDRWILKNERPRCDSDIKEFSDSVLNTGDSGDSRYSAHHASKTPTNSEKVAMAATVFLFYRLFTGVDINNLEMDKLRRFIKPDISETLMSKIREIMVYLLIRSKPNGNTEISKTIIHQSVECFLKTANFCFKTQNSEFKISEQFLSEVSNSSPSISSPSYSPFKSSRKTLIIGDSLLRDQHSKFIQKGSSVDVICLPGQTVQGVFSTLQNMVGTLKIGKKFENSESGQELRIKSLLQIKKLIIHCGTNDASTKFSVKDLEKVIDMYAKMVNFIAKEFVEIEDIVVTTLIPRFDQDKERVLDFNRILKNRFERDLAQDKRVKLENLYMVMVNQIEFYQPDYLHLNDEGKEKLHDSLDKISRDSLDDNSEKNKVEIKNPENLKILKTSLDFVITNGWILSMIREICSEGDPATLKCSYLLPIFYDKMYFGGSEASKFVKNIVECGVDFGSIENNEKLQQPAPMSNLTFAPFQKLKQWHISDNMTINRISKTIDSTITLPILLPENTNFITPKILVLDTNLYLETENVELLTDLILKDFLKNFDINLYIPKIVQDEMLGIAQEQDKKVERAMTGRKLVHGLLLHDQVCEKEIPKHILVKHAQGHANDKKSNKNKKAADDVLLDYCVWLEQQSWKFNPTQISRVVFITHDKNLKLKAEMVFDNCGEPRPVHLESIRVLKNLFRDLST